MKPSEQFQSMDEVHQYVESFKKALSPENYETLRFLFGLLDNAGQSEFVEIDGVHVAIDKSISSIIKTWNNKGIKTLACCSGIAAEHCNTKYFSACGYISFAFDKGLYDKLLELCKDRPFEINLSEAYLQPDICVRIRGSSDTEILEMWRYLYSKL